MEAPGGHRWTGEARRVGVGVGVGGSNYIAKHVGIQNQVLKCLQHFSDRVEERAKEAATEVNGLLEEAGALELDMKTAVLAFDNLTRQRFTEHAMSTYSPLPHIIGSEEYNHDNSCGLADDAQTMTDDFSWLREFQGESSYSGPDDLYGSQILEVQQGFEKGQTDSLVSASREFRAMLEAALVNPYKFYDDASTTASDASVEHTSTSEVHYNKDPALATRMGGAAGERTKADNTEEAELLASLQNPDINVHDIYSALVREGLFDAGDEILAVDRASGSDNPGVGDLAESSALVNENVLNEDEKLNEDDNAASPSEKVS